MTAASLLAVLGSLPILVSGVDTLLNAGAAPRDPANNALFVGIALLVLGLNARSGA